MAFVIPKIVGLQGQRAHCSASVTWGLLVGPGIKAALHKSSGHIHKELARPSQLLSDPRQFLRFVLDPLKSMAGRLWGRVSAGHFFLLFLVLLFLWLLQQLFGFCPLLGGGRSVWPNTLHLPRPKDPP